MVLRPSSSSQQDCQLPKSGAYRRARKSNTNGRGSLELNIPSCSVETEEKKGCEFPVASQSRSLPQIRITKGVAPPSIYRAAVPGVLWLLYV